MTLALIVALDRNGLIGRAGHLPWHLPADLQHFKNVTMGKTIIMGRRTCESLARPLPGRRNLVLTRNPSFRRDGFEVFHQPHDIFDRCVDDTEAVIIGGADIYRLFLPFTQKAYVTLIEGAFEGDTWFPLWPLTGWSLCSATERLPDDRNPHRMTFMIWENPRPQLKNFEPAGRV